MVVADAAVGVDLVVVGVVVVGVGVVGTAEVGRIVAVLAEGVAVVESVVVAVAVDEPFEQDVSAAAVDDCPVLCSVEVGEHLLDLDQAIDAALVLVIAGIQVSDVVDLGTALAVQAHRAGAQTDFATVHYGRGTGEACS